MTLYKTIIFNTLPDKHCINRRSIRLMSTKLAANINKTVLIQIKKFNIHFFYLNFTEGGFSKTLLAISNN